MLNLLALHFSIDSVIGKNGQIQQNISTHEKQSEENNKSQKRSGPTL